jgi:BASS family bile acid:Na+ symporter
MNELSVTITRWAMLVFLLASMLELGLSLSLREVIAPLTNVRLLLGALLANFVLVPLLAFGIGKAMGLEKPFAIGLLLLGLAPGAPFIPKLVQLARGNVALAVGLMVLLMVGSAIDLPWLLPRMLAGVKLDAWEIEKSLFLLMLLPLAVGLAVHARFLSLPAWLRPALGVVGNLGALVVLVLIVWRNFNSVLSLFGTGAILASVLFVGLSTLAGWWLGGPDRATRVTLALGTSLRNVAAALMVGAQNFKDPKVNVMVSVTALVGLLLLLPAASAFGRRAQAAIPSPQLLTSPPGKRI